MSVIYKYTLELQQEQTLSLPADAEILTIQIQSGVICAWVRLDTLKPERTRTLVICGTGDNPPENGRYVATVQTPPMVWHFFEL